jgi:exodeoxyribonuclease VII small subunit
VAKEKAGNRGQYEDVVTRLQRIVETLEAGDLPLEESLERFSEGVRLVKQGEKLLSEAEQRVEQLLSEDGKTAPLRVGESAEPTSSAGPVLATGRREKPSPAGVDDDVPF